MSTLDQDFEKIVKQINTKIREAAKSLIKANELAAKAGLPSLIYTQFIREEIFFSNNLKDEPLERKDIEDMIEKLEKKLSYIDVSLLEGALDDGGWSTSSSYC